MASKSTTFLACLLLLNLISCTMVTAHYYPSSKNTCPKNTLDIKLCANVLKGLVHIPIGIPPRPCCSLIEGLVDLDAAVCLCAALKVKVPGIIDLNVPVDLSLYFNQCSRTCPPALKHCA